MKNLPTAASKLIHIKTNFDHLKLFCEVVLVVHSQRRMSYDPKEIKF